LGSIQDETNIVEGGRHKTSKANTATAILPDECIVKRQGREEIGDRRDEKLELRSVRLASLLVFDWVRRLETPRRSA
jgi:hypothetical protein